MVLVAHHPSQVDDDVALRKTTRDKRLAISSDYVVYLQESKYNIRVKNDPQTFS